VDADQSTALIRDMRASFERLQHMSLTFTQPTRLTPPKPRSSPVSSGSSNRSAVAPNNWKGGLTASRKRSRCPLCARPRIGSSAEPKFLVTFGEGGQPVPRLDDSEAATAMGRAEEVSRQRAHILCEHGKQSTANSVSCSWIPFS
jgi:hypothetical protein